MVVCRASSAWLNIGPIILRVTNREPGHAG